MREITLIIILLLLPFHCSQGIYSNMFIRVVIIFDITGQCGGFFIVQPPVSLNCNPFDDANNTQISLLCIGGPHQQLMEYGIRWIYNEKRAPMESTITSTSRRLIISHYTGLTSNDNMTGVYYCESYNQTSNTTIHTSNKLTILQPENYTNLSSCPSIITQECDGCSDLSQSLSPSLSTTSSDGWIAGFVFFLIISLVLLSIIIICVPAIALALRKAHHHPSNTTNGNSTYNIIHANVNIVNLDLVASKDNTSERRKKTKKCCRFPTYRAPVSDEKEEGDTYDYMEWKNRTSTDNYPVYVQPNSPEKIAEIQVHTKLVGGNLYAIADLETRDIISPYEKIETL
jgi:hypothetical protein